MNQIWRLLIAFGLSVSAFAQGQVNFNNKVSASGIDARIIIRDGLPATTPPFAAGLAIDAGGVLVYVPGSATSFRSGPAAGYIQPLVVTIPGHNIQSSVTLLMFAFQGGPTDADASAALNSGRLSLAQSNPVTVSLGGGVFLPPDMVGLQPVACLFCPEPSTIMLAFLGATALLWRKKPPKR